MARKLFIYRPDHPKASANGFIEVGDEEVTYDKRVDVMTDRYMEGVAAIDGTDISSRRKRKEYMHVRGLADADDFTGVWAKAADERAKYFKGEHEIKERREAIERAWYQKHKP